MQYFWNMKFEKKFAEFLECVQDKYRTLPRVWGIIDTSICFWGTFYYLLHVTLVALKKNNISMLVPCIVQNLLFGSKNAQYINSNAYFVRYSVILCFTDRPSRYIHVKKANLMHCLSSVYFYNQPLHVSGIFVAHHQAVYSIYTKIGTCCIYTVYLLLIGYRMPETFKGWLTK